MSDLDDPKYTIVVVTPTRIEVMGMAGMTPEVWEA